MATLPNKKFRVLIVDDSAVVRQTLSEVLSKDPAIEVIGTACDPFVAADRIAELDEAAKQASPLSWRGFGHEQNGPAPFASETHSLQQPQHDKEDRCQDADLFIGR